MSKSVNLKETWQTAMDKIAPVTRVLKAVGRMLNGILNVIDAIVSFFFKYRKIFLAIPVVALTIWIAMNNLEELPELVGLDLQPDGTFRILVPRSTAVLCPALLTGVCLLFMLISRRTLYPWLISLFTLVVPFLILLTNYYPL